MIWCSTITDSYNTADTKDPLEGIHYQFHTPNTIKIYRPNIYLFYSHIPLVFQVKIFEDLVKKNLYTFLTLLSHPHVQPTKAS